MFVSRCSSHSWFSHFLHPTCPHHHLLEKVEKIFFLAIGFLLIRMGYRRLTDYLRAQIEKAERLKFDREEFKRLEQAHLVEQMQAASALLKTQGKCLSSIPLFCCLDFLQRKFPDHLSYVKDAVQGIGARPDECPRFNHFLAIPIIEKGWFGWDHIVLLLIEKKTNNSYHLEFFDSKGYSLQKNPNSNLWKQDLEKWLSFASFHEQIIHIQSDRYNCGVFIYWYLEQRLSGKTPKELSSVDIEPYRLNLAQQLEPKRKQVQSQ